MSPLRQARAQRDSVRPCLPRVMRSALTARAAAALPCQTVDKHFTFDVARAWWERPFDESTLQQVRAAPACAGAVAAR